MSPNVKLSLSIPGWMTENELLYLENISYGKDLVVELGSWCGRSSIALSSAKKLICVDIWDMDIISEETIKILNGINPEKEFDKNTSKLKNIIKEKGDLNNKS